MARIRQSAKWTSLTLTGTLLLALFAGACDEANPLGTDRLNEISTLEPVAVDISPDGAVLDSGQVVKFTAKLTDVNGNPVSASIEWETDAGTITSDGLLTAKAGPGRHKVVAKHRGNGPNKRDLADTTYVDISRTSDNPEPVSLFVTPQTVVIGSGDTVAFDFVLNDGNGGIIDGGAEWSATGGTIDGTGLYVAGGQAGEFQVVAASGTLADTASVEVSASEPSNTAPTANFAVECTDLGCSYDASGSTDSDGSIASFAWDFGDGKSGSGRTVSHTYTSGGTYSVRLTVTDNDGASASRTQDVSVEAPPPPEPTNEAPTANFASSCTDLGCSFDASSSSDSDGSIAGYAWQFGDGASGSGRTASHAYASGGTYSVRLTVTDNDGASSSKTRSVSVQPPPPPNAAPTANFTLNCTDLGCSFDGSSSSDSDGSIAGYAWQFGDGASGSGRTASHNYASGGTYTVRLTVTDNDGASGSKTRSATVSAPTPPNPDVDVEISPGQSIQNAVDANPAGTTFLLKSGIHRRQRVRPKDGNTFLGELGTVLDGEGVTSYAIRSGADNVTIRGLRVTGYTPSSTFGAIEADWDQGRGWTVEDCEIHHNRAAGVKIGHEMVFRGNYVHHNGQYGLHGWGNNALIEDNEISHNNTEGYDPLWDAGGMKLVRSDGLVFRNNHVHSNFGIGVWFDANNIRVTIEDNLIEDNEAAGIYYEISYQAVIRNNRIFRNGDGSADRISRSGIVISESSDVEVYGNTLAGNENGISAMQAERGTGYYGEWLVENLWVHDNDVTMERGASGLADWKGDGGIFNRNNRFDRNTYRISGNSLPFRYGGRISESTWRSKGQDANSTFLR